MSIEISFFRKASLFTEFEFDVSVGVLCQRLLHQLTLEIKQLFNYRESTLTYQTSTKSINFTPQKCDTFHCTACTASQVRMAWPPHSTKPPAIQL